MFVFNEVKRSLNRKPSEGGHATDYNTVLSTMEDGSSPWLLLRCGVAAHNFNLINLE